MLFRNPTRKRGYRQKAAAALASLTLSLYITMPAGARADQADELADLSLEELLGMEITTLSRKTENLGGAPAAVFVISQSDIRRSGARTVPDLLRMVPGIQVAQIDGNKWAVTARGANGRFANKLLVLRDGRTLYNPLLSGVYWDVQDTDLDAIERIEVIRGPGATMWGANAVNGVVNIITSKAADTQGGSVNLLASDRDSMEGVVRYGGTTEDTAYRVFAKFTERDANVGLIDAIEQDDSRMTRVGARVDRDRSGRELSFSSEAYSGHSGETRTNLSPAPPYTTIAGADDDLRGAFALMRWSEELSPDSSLQFRGYYSYDERHTTPFEERRSTLDVDIQHQFAPGHNHNIMWGLAYRNSADRTVGTFQISLDPANRSQRLLSGFIQDDVSLFDERARLIIGSKFEHGNFSDRDVEIEPSVRFSLDLSEHTTAWGAVSKAVRLPSRGELDGVITGAVLAPGNVTLPLPVPVVAVVQGNPQMKSEEVIAYELGFRLQREDLILDLALFYSDYEKLRSLDAPVLTCQPGDQLLISDPACIAAADFVLSESLLGNRNTVDSHGVEVALSKQLADWWRIHAGYTYYRFDIQSITADTGFVVAEDSPENQFSLRSSMDLPRDMELDLWLRYVDELEAQEIDSYTALDLRLTWSPTTRLRVAAVGRNLLAGTHMEFMSELGDLEPVRIEPEGYLEVTWSF